MEGVVPAVLPDGLADAFFQTRAELFQAVVGVSVQELPELGKARRHGDGVAGEGARLVHGAERCQTGQDVLAAAEGGQRHATADDFAQRRQVRCDVVVTLYAL